MKICFSLKRLVFQRKKGGGVGLSGEKLFPEGNFYEFYIEKSSLFLTKKFGVFLSAKSLGFPMKKFRIFSWVWIFLLEV